MTRMRGGLPAQPIATSVCPEFARVFLKVYCDLFLGILSISTSKSLSHVQL